MINTVHIFFSFKSHIQKFVFHCIFDFFFLVGWFVMAPSLSLSSYFFLQPKLTKYSLAFEAIALLSWIFLFGSLLICCVCIGYWRRGYCAFYTYCKMHFLVYILLYIPLYYHHFCYHLSAIFRLFVRLSCCFPIEFMYACMRRFGSQFDWAEEERESANQPSPRYRTRK